MFIKRYNCVDPPPTVDLSNDKPARSLELGSPELEFSRVESMKNVSSLYVSSLYYYKYMYELYSIKCVYNRVCTSIYIMH